MAKQTKKMVRLGEMITCKCCGKEIQRQEETTRTTAKTRTWADEETISRTWADVAKCYGRYSRYHWNGGWKLMIVPMILMILAMITMITLLKKYL